jgi:hypothetical protein
MGTHRASCRRLDVVVDRLSGLFGQLALDGPFSFAAQLRDRWPTHVEQHPRPEADDITASELAVDGEIEHCEIASSTFDLQLGRDRPDMFRSQGLLGAKQFASVPRGSAGVWIVGYISIPHGSFSSESRGKPARANPTSASSSLFSEHSGRAGSIDLYTGLQFEPMQTVRQSRCQRHLIRQPGLS